MAARNLYLLLAREVSVDAADNMNSIIKIIEKFTSTVSLSREEWDDVRAKQPKGVTTIPVTYALATSWLFDKKLPEDAFITLKIETIDPSGTNLVGMEQEHVVPRGTNKANLNINVQGLPVTLPGNYILRASLLSKSKKVLAEAEYPYEVELSWELSKR